MVSNEKKDFVLQRTLFKTGKEKYKRGNKNVWWSRARAELAGKARLERGSSFFYFLTLLYMHRCRLYRPLGALTSSSRSIQRGYVGLAYQQAKQPEQQAGNVTTVQTIDRSLKSFQHTRTGDVSSSISSVGEGEYKEREKGPKRLSPPEYSYFRQKKRCCPQKRRRTRFPNNILRRR